MKSKVIGLHCFILALVLSNPAFAKVTKDLQFENEHVRVWKTTIPPNERLPLHRHDYGRVLVSLKGGPLTRFESDGKESIIPLENAKALWANADPQNELHGDYNPSDRPIEVMVIEVKHTAKHE